MPEYLWRHKPVASRLSRHQVLLCIHTYRPLSLRRPTRRSSQSIRDVQRFGQPEIRNLDHSHVVHYAITIHVLRPANHDIGRFQIPMNNRRLQRVEVRQAGGNVDANFESSAAG